MALTFDTPSQPDAKLSLGYTGPEYVSDSTAELLSSKADYGMSGLWGKSREDLKSAIKSGKEAQLRTEAASAIDSQASGEIYNMAVKDPELAVKYLQNIQPTDPDTVFETSFAQRYSQLATNLDAKSEDYTWFKEAWDIVPEAVQAAERLSGYTIAKEEVLRKYTKELEDAVAHQSAFGYGVDWAKQLIPFYQEVKTRGRIEGVGFFKGLLRGNNYEAQRDELFSQNVPNFNKVLRAALDPLRESNPTLALALLRDLTSYSTSDKYLNNVFTLVDIATNIGVLKAPFAIAKGVVLARQAESVFKDITKSVEAAETKPIAQAAAAGAGHLDEAGIKREVASTTARVFGKEDIQAESIERLQSGMRLDQKEMREDPGNYGTEFANRLADASEKWADKWFDRFSKLARVMKISKEQFTESALRELAEKTKRKYSGPSNQVINQTDPFLNPITNTWHHSIYFGKADGTLWDKEKDVKGFLEFSAYQDVKLFGKGGKWGFFITRPVDTKGMFRQTMLNIPGSESPKGFLNSFLTWFITPEETLSLQHNIQRKLATYPSSVLFQMAQERLAPVRKLARTAFAGTPGKARLQRLEAILDDAKNHWDPAITARGEEETPLNKGYFYKTPGELQNAYSALNNGILPHPVEVEAYFAWRDILEAERSLGNARVYSQLNDMGAEQFRIRHAVRGSIGNPGQSGWFNAVRGNAIPVGDHPMIYVSKDPDEHILYARPSNFGGKKREEVEKGLQDGTWTYLHIADPEREVDTLSNWSSRVASGGYTVHHILIPSSKFENKALDWEQIPRRAGGHLDYDAYDHWIKVANVRHERYKDKVINKYFGDMAIAPVKIRAMGKDLIRRLNDVRELIVKDDWAGAEKLFNSFVTGGLEWKDFSGWYKKTKRTVNGKTVEGPPRLSKHEPFHLVPRGGNIWGIDRALQDRYATTDPISGVRKANIENETKTGLMRRFYVEHTEQRDSYDMVSPKNEGTPDNPLYNFHPAETASLIPSTNRALAKAIHGVWMDDYKSYAMNSWVQEALKEGILEGSWNDFNNAPYWVFNHVEYKKDADNLIKSQFEANRIKIRNFMGVQNVTDTFLHSAAQQLNDMVYGKFGEGKAQLIPGWLLAHSKDPFQTLRSITFNLKMGLFSIPQFMVHAMTYVNVMGIAGPVRASQGALGALMHGMTVFNRSPEFLDLLDKYASKFGAFKPGEWKEAYHELENSGFLNEQGSYILKNSSMSTKVIQNGLDQFLDLGQMFFRGGVRSLRAGSWYTAYKEARSLSKTEALDFGKILNRADLLSHNMSRASASILNSGFLSIPFQFQSYFLRLTEMFWGKRLSALEKARLFGVNAAVFGIPTAAGLTGFPVDKYFRETARDHGYVVGDNFWQSLMVEGVGSAVGAIISGEGDSKKGTWYDPGERWGPAKGWEPLGDILQTDKTVYEILGGAAGTTFANTLSNLTGFTRAAYAGITGNPDAFPLNIDDAADIANEVASVFNFKTAYHAMMLGRLISRRGTYVADSSKAQAIMLGLTGLRDQKIVDLYSMEQQLKHQRQAEDFLEQKFNLEINRWLQALSDGYDDQAKAYATRAFGYLEFGDFPIQRRARLMQRAAEQNRPLIEKIPQQYYLGPRTPTSEVPGRQEAYGRLQGLK